MVAPKKASTTDDSKAVKASTTNSVNTMGSSSTSNQGAVDPVSTRQATTTRLKIRYNCGFNNSLFIRGKGANLSWDKGQPLKNVRHDEWVWETNVLFTQCEFKVLINDTHYEQGDNHQIRNSDTFEYTPRF